MFRSVAAPQVALSELYSNAPSPVMPRLAGPPFDMAPPSSAFVLQPNGLDTMRLSEETAGRGPPTREPDRLQSGSMVGDLLVREVLECVLQLCVVPSC